MMYRIKGAIRWLRFQTRIGVTYHEYDADQIESAKNFEHHLGWYTQFGHCIVFKGADGELKFVW